MTLPITPSQFDPIVSSQSDNGRIITHYIAMQKQKPFLSVKSLSTQFSLFDAVKNQGSANPVDRRFSAQPPESKNRGDAHSHNNRFSRLTNKLNESLIPIESNQSAFPDDLILQNAQSIMTYNPSSDLPFDRHVDPYSGRKPAGDYRYARQPHAYWNCSSELDVGSDIIIKHNTVELLEQAICHPGYVCRPIAIGANTEAYQPIETQLRTTRRLLKTLLKYRHPVTLLSKSKLILRDLDILQDLSKLDLVQVGIGLTSLDHRLTALMEPHAASARARLGVLKTLCDQGIPSYALITPVIPALNDHEIERLIYLAAESGVKQAKYALVRLPYEFKQTFSEWLQHHFPYKHQKVLNLLTETDQEKRNPSNRTRQITGDGVYAQLFGVRFKSACNKFGINQTSLSELNTQRFVHSNPKQLSLI